MINKIDKAFALTDSESSRKESLLMITNAGTTYKSWEREGQRSLERVGSVLV